ncbi:hypothetical protein [Novosphingobium beihaiensis]|uniref:Uncharacterized protein n=1 Tax=Novosphingobium beihaiensis TaxID=2930389 RepID=A0ABT0BW35_9SPHN|nr:hypothetical protein [Novosphingobium beihaiensis]MCJ2189268.1 hypothetical protein [Novosphingobium beihaiensis]
MKLIAGPILAGLLTIPLPATAATRPQDLSGASRAQYDRVQRDRDQIAADLRLSRKTVDAIAAVVLGKQSRLNDTQLVNAIREQARTARRLLDENGKLRERIAYLENPAIRDPALAALNRAHRAIDEGRFTDAEFEYATIRQIRWDQVHDGLESWKAAVDGQAGAAILAGEYDRAEDLRLAAGEEMRARLEAAGKQAQWEQICAAARERYQYGDVFGAPEALERAASLYRERALPMYPEPSWQWAQVENSLGIVLGGQGERTGGAAGVALLDRSEAA